MLDKPLEAVTKADIDELIENKVPERRHLDYKEKLPGPREQDGHAFRFDVSAMANTGGGDLVYGVQEERDEDGQPTNMPHSAMGLDIANLGKERGRLEQLLRTCIDPPIRRVQIKQIDGFGSGPVLIVRIPRSSSGPHGVWVSGSRRFYARHDHGNFLLGVDELRSAFLSSETFAERARAFRRDRLIRLLSGDTPVRLMGESLIALHLVSAGSTREFLAPAESGNRLGVLPLSGGGGPLRFNLDGALLPGATSTAGDQ